MQSSLAQLPQLLAGPLAPLYCLAGDEILLVQEACDQIRATARKQDFSDKTIFNVTGANYNWQQILIALQSQSLFAERQIIEIRIPSGKPGRDGATALTNLTKLLAQTKNVCIITLPKLDKASQNSAWFKALNAAGIYIAIAKIERRNLPQWIATRLAQNQLQLPSGNEGRQLLDFFSDKVQGNLLAAQQEIQKLVLMVEPNSQLSFEQVKNSVLNVARYDVFRLSEAILSGQIRQVDTILRGLQQEGEAEVFVHWAIAEDIRVLHKIKVAQHNGTPLLAALRENRVWGLKEKLMERIAPRVSLLQTNRLLQDAHNVDGIIKGIPAANWPQDNWQALHRLAMRLSETAAIPPQLKRY